MYVKYMKIYKNVLKYIKFNIKCYEMLLNAIDVAMGLKTKRSLLLAFNSILYTFLYILIHFYIFLYILYTFLYILIHFYMILINGGRLRRPPFIKII